MADVATKRSGIERFLVATGSSVDRAVLRFMGRVFLRGARSLPADESEILAQVERAAAFYGQTAHVERPETFFRTPPPIAPDRRNRRRLWDGGERVDLFWESGYLAALESYRERYARYRRNGQACARLLLHAEPRPAMICVHGWMGGSRAGNERQWFADRLYNAGFDVALPTLPFHGLRAPGGPMSSGRLFPSLSIARSNEAFAQSIWDLRGLRDWLVARGAPRAGFGGISLGGNIVALLATLEPIAFAVLLVPLASIADVLWAHGEDRPERQRAERIGISRELLRTAFRAVSPLARPPRIAPDRVLVVAGQGDLITGVSQADRLRAHFGPGELHVYPGGHVLQFRRTEVRRTLRKFLARMEPELRPLREYATRPA